MAPKYSTIHYTQVAHVFDEGTCGWSALEKTLDMASAYAANVLTLHPKIESNLVPQYISLSLSYFYFVFVPKWVRMNPKARQAKSKARLARYDSLSQADEAADAAASASLESIFIPPGNPLGTTVVEAKVNTAHSCIYPLVRAQ